MSYTIETVNKWIKNVTLFRFLRKSLFNIYYVSGHFETTTCPELGVEEAFPTFCVGITSFQLQVFSSRLETPSVELYSNGALL